MEENRTELLPRVVPSDSERAVDLQSYPRRFGDLSCISTESAESGGRKFPLSRSERRALRSVTERFGR